MTTAVDVTLPSGWFPLAPIRGLLLAAVCPDRSGRSRATLVVRMARVPAVGSRPDLGLLDIDARDGSVRDVRWCAPGVVAVIAASGAVGRDELVAAVRQTAVYAVDSGGKAMTPSSAGDANAGWRASTRTV